MTRKRDKEIKKERYIDWNNRQRERDIGWRERERDIGWRERERESKDTERID